MKILNNKEDSIIYKSYHKSKVETLKIKKVVVTFPKRPHKDPKKINIPQIINLVFRDKQFFYNDFFVQRLNILKKTGFDEEIGDYNVSFYFEKKDFLGGGRK